MKRIITILLLLALMLSFAACGEEPAAETEATTNPATEPVVEDTKSERIDVYSINTDDLWEEYYAAKTVGTTTDEELYGHINQLEPINGVYKIWNAEGVKNMANHPDATFEFLCSIDMEGATLRPIGTKEQPFTGTIKGMNTILSNFTITESVDGYLGFIGYNKGSVRDLKLEEMTIVADANAKYIGGMAGYSESDLKAITVNGSITVENAAEDAVCGGIVGYTCANVVNSASDMDITYTAAGSATIGGCMGIAEGIRAEYTENYGFLEISGTNKTIGLIAGQAKDIDLYSVAFLGERNHVDGVMFTNYFGISENEKYEKVLVRDNTPYEMDPNVEKLRDTVVDYMYTMATIRWATDEEVYYDCHCLLGSCHGKYQTNYLHIGMPYKHYSSNLARFEVCLDEDNYLKKWVTDMPGMEGYDVYVGNDCLGSIQSAWWTVSNSTNVVSIQAVQPARGVSGTIPVGNWPYEVDVPADKKSAEVLFDLVPLDVWFDAYAQVRKGDVYCAQNNEGSGHIRMAQENPVVVRDENGKIDGDYSYIVTVEQGAPTQLEPFYTSWRWDYKYTFKNLAWGGYCPVTCEELLTGEMEPVEAKLTGATEGKAGMTLGVVETNYNISSVTLEIKDSQGNVVFSHRMNPNTAYYSDFSAYTMGIRNIRLTFEMSKFATPLRNAQLELGQTYSYSVSVQVNPGDIITVHESTFVNGNAQ